MTQPNTTRRALLGAATTAFAYAGGAAIVGGAAVVASEARGATRPVDRTAWNAAVAAFNATTQASDKHWRYVEKPAWDELQRTHPHPGSSFTVPSKDGMVGTMCWYENDPNAYEKCHPPVRDAARAYRAKLDAWAQTHERLGLTGIHAKSDQHLEQVTEAEDRLFETPAPDIAAVMVKLEALWADERDPIHDYNALVLADVRRLVGETQA